MNGVRLRGYRIAARAYVVLMALAFAATALIVRAIDVQVLRSDFYQSQGDARHLREIAIPISRGAILDRHGEPLAMSSPVDSLWANPRALIADPDAVARLAEAIGARLADLDEQIRSRADREFIWIRRHLPPHEAEAILARKIPGVHAQREFRRFYPGGEAFAHVIGSTDIDGVGREGLELVYDGWLNGKPGAQRVLRDRLGRVIEVVERVRAPEPGRDLVLSLDRRLQYLAHRELKRALVEHRAASGSIVVLDVSNGEVLAMVNLPSYNPNSRQAADAAARRNRAVTDVFEPGSVIKPFTVLAGLESGRFRPDSVIDTSPGRLPIARHVVRDIRNFGALDLAGLLAKSSNVGAVKIAQAVPDEDFHHLLRRFGFGQATGSGFPGESGGILNPPRQWHGLEKATLSYGYGLSATALQLAQAYAALGNGGRLRAPTFLRGEHNPEIGVIDPALARRMVEMLEGVTRPGGTAQLAGIPGYRVAGKTGTSRRAVPGGYDSRYISVFAGLVPASRPRLAAVIVIHDPRGAHYYAGLVAAPVFGRVMAEAVRLFAIPPDQPAMLASAASARPEEGSPESVVEAPLEGPP